MINKKLMTLQFSSENLVYSADKQSITCPLIKILFWDT